MIMEMLIAGVVGAIGYFVLADNKTNKICKSGELRDISGDGIICSRHVQLSEKQSNEHVLMIAPSGSGKTRKVIMPNVNALENCSLIVTDPAGEIEKECAPNKKKYIINPFREDTIGYDPLQNCRSEFEVRKMAKTILSNGMVQQQKDKGTQQEWVDMATPLLTAYMLFNYHVKRYSFSEMIETVCTAPIILPIEEGKEPQYCLYGEIITSGVESAITEINAFIQVIQARQTLSSIRTVLNCCLQMFLDENVKRMTDKPGIEFSQLRKEESVLYIQIPERHADYFAPLTATLITQLLDRLLDDDGLQVYMLLDEAANIGSIPAFTKLLSTARKHAISVCCFLQSISQFERVYGGEGVELRELFKTLLVTGGLKQSAEYISNILGVEEDMKTRQQTPLMTPDEVRRLDTDEMLIICNNKRPVLDTMMDVYVGGNES